MITSTGFVAEWLTELVLSGVVIVVGIALIGAIRIGRRQFADRFNAVFVDVISSIGLIVVVSGGVMAIADIWGQTDVLLEQLGFLRLDHRAPAVVITAVVLVATQVFAGIAKRLLEDLTTESQTLTEHQREVGLRITQLTLWTIGIIVILGIWEVDLTGLLVGAGFLGIVLGLASRKTLGSLIAGLVLMFSRPFEVGDWIVVDKHEGWVTDITMMSTRVRGFDGTYIVVPNDVVNSEVVLNRSRQGRIRVEVDVGIDYSANIEKARSIAKQAAEGVVDDEHAAIRQPAPDVLVRSFGESAVNLRVRLWLERPTPGEVNAVRDKLVARLKEALDEAEISIPYPQREISTREGAAITAVNDGEKRIRE